MRPTLREYGLAVVLSLLLTAFAAAVLASLVVWPPGMAVAAAVMVALVILVGHG